MTHTPEIRPNCDGVLELHFKITTTQTEIYPNLFSKGHLSDEALDMLHGSVIIMLLDILHRSKSSSTKEKVLEKIALQINANANTEDDETCH